VRHALQHLLQHCCCLHALLVLLHDLLQRRWVVQQLLRGVLHVRGAHADACSSRRRRRQGPCCAWCWQLQALLGRRQVLQLLHVVLVVPLLVAVLLLLLLLLEAAAAAAATAVAPAAAAAASASRAEGDEACCDVLRVCRTRGNTRSNAGNEQGANVIAAATAAQAHDRPCARPLEATHMGRSTHSACVWSGGSSISSRRR
jgi:hypothetical protein